MTYKRRDVNHKEVRQAFRDLGCRVCDTADLGHGAGDLIVSIIPGSFMLWVEVKDGEQPPSAQRLTPDEEKFHKDWEGDIIIIRSVDEAIELVNMVRRLEHGQSLLQKRSPGGV